MEKKPFWQSVTELQDGMGHSINFLSFALQRRGMNLTSIPTGIPVLITPVLSSGLEITVRFGETKMVTLNTSHGVRIRFCLACRAVEGDTITTDCGKWRVPADTERPQVPIGEIVTGTIINQSARILFRPDGAERDWELTGK